MAFSFVKKCLTAVLLPLILLSPVSHHTQALELGFTPSHVYGLWIRINQVLLAYAELVSQDEAWLLRIRQVPVEPVVAKQSDDVLQKVNDFKLLFKTILPQLIVHKNLVSHESLLMLEDDDDEISPTQVYLSSTHLLFDMVGFTLDTSNPDIVIGHFFRPPQIVDKGPSDVFALVIQAHKRLQAIISRQQTMAGQKRS